MDSVFLWIHLSLKQRCATTAFEHEEYEVEEDTSKIVEEDMQEEKEDGSKVGQGQEEHKDENKLEICDVPGCGNKSLSYDALCQGHFNSMQSTWF